MVFREGREEYASKFPFASFAGRLGRPGLVDIVKTRSATLRSGVPNIKWYPPSEVNKVKKELEAALQKAEQYKFASESFERRVLDLQNELKKKDEEIQSLKERFSLSLAARQPASESNEEEDPLVLRKLFVGGLPQSVTDHDLTSHFAQYGNVIHAVVMKDTNTHKSRGFGFVIYSSASMADTAQAARPHKILGKEVETKRAIPKSTIESVQVAPKSMIQSRRVFVGGLKTTTTNEILRDYFRTFGTIESINVMEDSKNKRSRGFAYVTFLDSDVADKVALQKFHLVDGQKCEVKPAFSKVSKGSRESFSGASSDCPGREYPHLNDPFHGAQQYDGYGYPYRGNLPELNSHQPLRSPAFACQSSLSAQRMNVGNPFIPEEQTPQYNASNNNDYQTWNDWKDEFVRWASSRPSANEDHSPRPVMNVGIRPIKNQSSFFLRSLKPY